MEKKSRAYVEPLMHEEDDEISNWEFINTSDIDNEEEEDEDDYEYYESEDSLHNEFESLLSCPSREDQEDDQYSKHHDDDDDDDHDEENEGNEEQSKEDENENEDEDGGGSGDNDLDDELVPWCVGDRFGRERMRKLGKRGCAKMNKSKRLAFMYPKPGCVHGKHGLGFKHTY